MIRHFGSKGEGGEFAAHFGYDTAMILSRLFIKLIPLSSRPYGRLYAY